MATWYTADTAEAQERLGAAWADAPISNTDLCGMLLETAREQVEKFAPDIVAPVYEPATVTWPDGSTAVFTREGDVARAALTMSATPVEGVQMPIPAAFVAAVYTEGAAIGLKIVSSGEGELYGMPSAVDTVGWLVPSSEGDGVPARWVFAQLQQARNLWNAGRVTGEGDVGGDGFVFRPYPLDNTIKQIIRPVSGYSHAL